MSTSFKQNEFHFLIALNFRSSIGNGHSWQSVAERINELERQNKTINTNNTNKNLFSNNLKNNANNQKFTYLDPAKTTRVPNMTLKAFQKNAVQSYFERQQQMVCFVMEIKSF